MGVLADADPVAAALTHLRGHAVAAGGAVAVAGTNAPPYPRLAVTDGDADDRDLRWLATVVLQVEALGDLDGTPGKPALRRLCLGAAEALAELPASGVVGGVVFTDVTSGSGARWSPLANRQPRYLTTVRLWWHPARP